MYIIHGRDNIKIFFKINKFLILSFLLIIDRPCSYGTIFQILLQILNIILEFNLEFSLLQGSMCCELLYR
jgi:hypothetical protein